jgi:hypothetical protein
MNNKAYENRILLGKVCDYDDNCFSKKLTKAIKRKKRLTMSDDDYIEKDYREDIGEWIDDWNTYCGEYN